MRNLLIIGCILLTPYLVSAQLVPCSGPDCQACHLVDLAQNIINFLILISAGLAAIAFAWAGILMATAAGNEGQVTKAKGIFTNVLVGFLIVLSAWLVIDTIMKIFVNESKIGPWNDIACGELPELRNVPIPFRGLTATGLNGHQLSGAELLNINMTGPEFDRLCEIAQEEGIGGECASLQAMMAIESGGCRALVSNANAHGCMQMIPSTARILDPDKLNGLTDEQIAFKLRTDSDYSMRLGVQLYGQLHEKYGNNYDYIYAGYNGGDGANRSSNSCTDETVWQCTVNTKYQETRNYVQAVNALRKRREIELTDPSAQF